MVKYWANSTDKEKSSQYKRAKNRYKYLRHSDQFDYIGNEFIPIDDLMDQMDLSNLENLLTSFDNFSKAGIEKDGQKIKAIFPWVRDIVLHKEVLRDLRVIRNAAAHGRPISFRYYFKIAFPLMIISIIISNKTQLIFIHFIQCVIM